MSWLLIAITFAGFPFQAEFRSKEACDAAIQALAKSGVIRNQTNLGTNIPPNAACVRQG